ncbi:hypothetical protein UYSO10_5350 [Kosakonia radicincitans]|nr:hypothetical protein UYSO10_5350 [Kosakonia radicincitans]
MNFYANNLVWEILKCMLKGAEFTKSCAEGQAHVSYVANNIKK